jgi:ATP-dependent Clp protease protease subunit
MNKKQRADETDDDEDVEKNTSFDNGDPFLVSDQRGQHIRYDFYDEITEPKRYLNLIRKLERATEHDLVELHFVCDGGRMDSMQAIMTAIKRCPARITGHLDSHAASAASLLFLCCDNWMITPTSYLMFHDFSGGLIGKGNEMTSQLSHYVNNFRMIMDQVCHPFLTKKEIDEIGRGKDLWLDATQLAKRLEMLGKSREKRK